MTRMINRDGWTCVSCHYTELGDDENKRIKDALKFFSMKLRNNDQGGLKNGTTKRNT